VLEPGEVDTQVTSDVPELVDERGARLRPQLGELGGDRLRVDGVVKKDRELRARFFVGGSGVHREAPSVDESAHRSAARDGGRQ
jgi:hypothetical protein